MLDITKISDYCNRNRIGSYLTLLMFPVLATLLALLMPRAVLWEYAPFHSFIESFGAAIAIGSSILILLFSEQQRISGIPAAIPLGLLVMGVLDGFHSAVSVKDGFVWLHSISVFVGGFLFSSIIVDYTWSERVSLRFVSGLVFGGGMSIGVASILASEYLPEMVVAGQFSVTAVGLNLVAGLGFIAAGLYLNHLYLSRRNRSLRLLAILSVLLGAAGVVFGHSVAWDPVWWWWHIIRLAAYLIALYFLFSAFKNALESLTRTKVRLDLATDAAKIGTWELDVATRRLDWDERMQEIYQQGGTGFQGDLDNWINLLHPEDSIRLKLKIDAAVRSGADFEDRFRVQLPNKSIRHIKFYAKVVRDMNDRPYKIVGTNWDVTSQVEDDDRIKNLALTDPLTGLPNRNLLYDRLNQGIAHCQRSDETLTIALLDLDGFKPVNDTLGHDAGDKLLQEVAHRLKSTLRPDDTVVRMGGDEFVLIFGRVANESKSEVILKRVLHSIAQPFEINAESIRVTASIGATFYPKDDTHDENLIRHADKAMYIAKERGKNTYALFDPTLEQRNQENLNTLRRIEKALVSEQFELYYQPQVNCKHGEIVGVEALLRWNHPILGVMLPGVFLPLIENDDLIVDVGDWVIDEASRQMDRWRHQGLDIKVGINISPRQLMKGNLRQKVQQITDQYGPDLVKRLEFEFIESAALEDLKNIGELVQAFQAQGVRFALDDFGTGFSSLSHLKHLSVDCLKIDQSFVRDMLDDSDDLGIIHGVLGLSKAFKSEVIAEGVESNEQILALLSYGCEIIQGYAISRPMPAEKCTRWIAAFRSNPIWRLAQDSYPTRDEFEILVNQAVHIHWLQKIQDVLMKRNEFIHIDQLADHGNCTVTEWMDAQRNKFSSHFMEFNELQFLHQKTHELADLVLGMRAGADELEHRNKFLELEAANNDLLERLEKTRRLIFKDIER